MLIQTADGAEAAMFRTLSGVKGQYHYLTLLVVSEFNEWRVFLYGPGVTIHGAREFSEAKARENAERIARTYIHEMKHEALPELAAVEWSPTDADDWLTWRG